MSDGPNIMDYSPDFNSASGGSSPIGNPPVIEELLTPEQLEEKLRVCAGYCLADNKIDELAAAINDIENVGSVRELMTMLRSA